MKKQTLKEETVVQDFKDTSNKENNVVTVNKSVKTYEKDKETTDNNLATTENNTKVAFTMKDVFDYGKIILFALVIAFILNNYIVANAKIPTGSMENTVMPKDRVFGNRLSYIFDEPKRGDIVIFHFPDDESQEFLKRIIGLPGDVIDIVDGKVFINDSDVPLKEDYIKDIPNGDFGPYKVPEDSYFMMGDNRDDSFDSRYWENTFVTREEIVAKAVLKYFPSIKILK